MTTPPAPSLEMAEIAARAAADKGADSVSIIDVSQQLVITDFFVIASADNERKVTSIVDEVEDRLREAGHKPARREGAREGRWALLDFVDIVVHVQHEEEFGYYALDRLWQDCPSVEIAGVTGRAAEHDAADGAAADEG